MAGKVRFSDKALVDLESTSRYIAKDSVYYARIFVQRVLRIVRSLNQFPEAGRIVPECDLPNIREKFLGHYRIVYRIHSEWIEIVAICHGSKLLKL